VTAEQIAAEQAEFFKRLSTINSPLDAWLARAELAQSEREKLIPVLERCLKAMNVSNCDSSAGVDLAAAIRGMKG